MVLIHMEDKEIFPHWKNLNILLNCSLNFLIPIIRKIYLFLKAKFGLQTFLAGLDSDYPGNLNTAFVREPLYLLELSHAKNILYDLPKKYFYAY